MRQINDHIEGIYKDHNFGSRRTMSQLASNDTKPSSADENVYKVYRSRWFMLFVASMLNLSTSMNWITFAAAADVSVEFYEISTFQLNLLSMCFVLITIPVGLTAAWLTDTFGLRLSFMIAAWANGVGSLLRNISAMDFVPIENKYSVVLTGQFLVACGEKCVMMLPTKLAAIWFPENQRAVANMLGGITDALGNMVAFIIVPQIVDVKSDIPVMLWVLSVPALILTLVTTVGVRRSVPPTPPSASAATVNKAFYPGLKKLIRNKNYLVLNVAFGAGFGVYVSILVLLEQALCPRGYSDEFAGLCGALMIATGTVFAALASIYIDRTKKYDEVFKISYGLAVLALIAFTQVARVRDMHVWLAVISAIFGGFALVLYPVGLELAVEVTFPVAAATSSGLCIISGSTIGIATMFIMQFLARPLPKWERKLESGCLQDGSFIPQDFTYSFLWTACCVTVVTFVMLVLFFRPKYKRLIEEKKATSKPQTMVYVVNKENNAYDNNIEITKL